METNESRDSQPLEDQWRPPPPDQPPPGWWLASDGRWYPPTANAPSPEAPSMTTRQSAAGFPTARMGRAAAVIGALDLAAMLLLRLEVVEANTTGEAYGDLAANLLIGIFPMTGAAVMLGLLALLRPLDQLQLPYRLIVTAVVGFIAAGVVVVGFGKSMDREHNPLCDARFTNGECPDPGRTFSPDTTAAPTITMFPAFVPSTIALDLDRPRSALDNLLDAWRSDDRDAAERLATPEAVSFLFESDRGPQGASAVDCRQELEQAVCYIEFPDGGSYYVLYGWTSGTIDEIGELSESPGA